MGTTIKLKKGTAKPIKFTVTDSDGAALDCSTATCTFTVKYKKSDSSAVLSKSDSDFIKTDAATGILRINLSATDTDITPKSYVSELKLNFSSTNIDKSIDFPFYIEEAVN